MANICTIWYTRQQMPRSDTRQDLLDAVVRFASGHGVSDLSLRQLAQAVGTSHRMLIYHFGSKEGLLVAIVGAHERAQRETAAEMLANTGGDPDDVLRRLWERLSDPGMWPSERLFFELYGQALQGRPGTADFLDGIVTCWTEPATAILRARGVMDVPELIRPTQPAPSSPERPSTV